MYYGSVEDNWKTIKRKEGRTMRLYRTELYKLCHKKSFLVWSFLAALFTVFFFGTEVGSETATVGETHYYGYEAVKMNRRIAKECQGVLDDEKVAWIVEKYGLPSEVAYGYPGWQDANCANGFVADYLSDGYMNGWDNYKVPTKVHRIADTELGVLQEKTGEEICFAYTKGWDVFFSTLQVGMVFASILILFGISTVFAQESQTRMRPLIFTTQEGQGKDIWAKIGAAFTLTLIIYGMAVVLAYSLAAYVFGMEGGQMPLGIALSNPVTLDVTRQATYMPAASFAWIMVKRDLAACLLLCAITMCVSAHYKSNFGAVTMAAALWGMPLGVSIFFGGFGYFIASCMPVFFIMTNSAYESLLWGQEKIMYAFLFPLFVFCVEEGYQIYHRRPQP